MIPQWSFDLHFSKVVMLNIFSCAFFPSVCFCFCFCFEKCLFRSAHCLIGLFFDIELHELFKYFGD